MINISVENAKYIVDVLLSKNVSINATINGQNMSVPLDAKNRHYAEIMRQVEAGTLVVAPA
jgi:hypothetical protein